MIKKENTASMIHKIPKDLKENILSTPLAQKTWDNITPLAKNEWVCWVTSAKKSETRNRRLRIMGENLAKGKRRPCCWAGCPHR